MRPQLRHRVGLYTPSTVQDDMGGTVISWSFDRALWAGIKHTGLSERVEDGRRLATHRYRIITRFLPNFPAQARLLWRGQTLRVVACSDPDARGERLHLICEAET
jgi:SPP1 family predicted phage head-tail adaptor